MEKRQRGAAKKQRGAESVTSALLWDDLRVFLACAHEGSLRSAARKLAVDSATVVRKMERLERLLNEPLFIRLPEGVRLTEAGARTLEQVRVMEQAVFNIARSTQFDAGNVSGAVKVAVTEGLGTYWILPRLLSFRQTHRRLTIEMDCAMTPTDVARLQADISIQFHRPEHPDLITVRLGYLHIYPFASRSYVQKHGAPTSGPELVNHQLIQQVGPMIDERLKEITSVAPEDIISFRTNGSTAMLYAVERDAGIGFLPSYASVLAPNLVPIDLGGSRRLDIWMTYHPDLKESRRHMVVAAWLKEIFDARRFPCFAEAFVHPKQLEALMSETAQINQGKNYFAPSPRVSLREFGET